MLTQTLAESILMAGAGIGFLVWLLQLRTYRQLRTLPTTDRFSTRVDNITPEDAVRAFLRQNLSNVDIVEQSNGKLHIQTPVAPLQLSFQPGVGQLDTELTVETNLAASQRGLLRVFAVFAFGLTPLVLLALTCVLWTFCVPSPNPAARWQVIQILQIVHVLWPPFLLAYLAHTRRREALRIAHKVPVAIQINTDTP